MIRVLRHPSGPRVYVAGLRLHHGTVGVALIVGGATVRRRAKVAAAAAAAGALLLAHRREYRDFPFRDTDNH